MTGRGAINVTDAAAVSTGAVTVSFTLPDVVLILSALWLIIRIGEWLWSAGKWLLNMRAPRD